MTDGPSRHPLEARLWGEARFAHRGVAVAPASRKASALLGYLVAAERPVPRDELACLLWGPGRLANVRQALYTLRALPGADEWLSEDTAGVRAHAVADVAGLRGAGAAALVEGLEGSELLAGLGDGLPAEYQEWLAGERARCLALVMQALAARVAELEAAGEVARALRVAVRAQELDPYDEEALRAAMRLAYLAGEPERALTAYAELASRLSAELGSEPGAESRALAERIERREALAPRAAVAALAEAERRTLQALALARGGLRLEGLALVLERPAFELAAELAWLTQKGLVDEHLALSAEQALAVLDGLPAPMKRLLHERIASVMRADEGADQGVLARQLLGAGQPVEAARRALAAARAALERSQLAPATDLLYLALWAAQDEPRLRLQACLALEAIASQRADLELQEALLREVERLAWELQSDPDLAEGNVRRARLHLARGRVGEGLEAALTALETALRLADAGLVARARNAVGAAHFYAGDLGGAAAAFAANLASEDEVERYRAHNNLGSINAMQGRLEDAYHHFDEALTLARRNSNHLDVSATLNNLAASAERLGDYQRAERHFREGIALARRRGATRREAEMLVNLAVVHARQGRLGLAWNTTAEVEALAGELGDGRLAMRVAEQRGEVMRLCSDLAGALAELGEAARLAEGLRDERKRRALEAQALTVRARLAPERVDEAERAIAGLEQAGLTDVAPWLRLELAMWTSDVAFGSDQLARSAEALQSAHQRLVRDVAEMRLALLPGADGAVVAAAEAARQRLVAAGVLPGLPPSAGSAGALPRPRSGAAAGPALGSCIVERPKARWLAAALTRLPDAPSRAGAIPDAPEDVLAELREQGAGLPRRLAAALLAAPAAWAASLGRST